MPHIDFQDESIQEILLILNTIKNIYKFDSYALEVLLDQEFINSFFFPIDNLTISEKAKNIFFNFINTTHTNLVKHLKINFL